MTPRISGISKLLFSLLSAVTTAFAQSPQAPVNPGAVPEPATIGMIGVAIAGGLAYKLLQSRRK